MNFVGSCNSAAATSAIIDFARLNYPEVIFCVKRSFLLRNGDDAKTTAVIVKSLVLKL
jgi:hypothetical protein